MTNPNLTPEQVERVLRSHRWMSYPQAKLIRDMVEERFAVEDEAGRAPFREAWPRITDRAQFENVLRALRALPTLAQREVEQLRQQEAEARAARAQAHAAEQAARREKQPTEEGLYRNPETGELYRLRRDKHGELIVSKYSATGGPRRLLTDTQQLTKGSWKRYTVFQSRMAFVKGVIDKAWLIDAKDLAAEYAYGFCPLHFGPLTDGVSVILGYGPDCAEKHGLPWSEAYAQQVLAERAREVS